MIGAITECVVAAYSFVFRIFVTKILITKFV